MPRRLAVLLLACWPALAAAQEEPARADSGRVFRPLRFWGGVGAIVAADAVAVAGLSDLWYSGYERQPFRWADDWPNWRQQDKIGHMLVAWQIARVAGHYGRWAGLSDRGAGLWGGAVSLLFQAQIEVLDGLSAGWGASWGDLLANTAGGVLGGLQIAYPRLNAVTLKYSYHPSVYYQPDLSPAPPLTYVGNVLKDYDGISYWLVVRPEMLLGRRAAERWPDWLALSIAHTADNLSVGPPNPPPFPQHRRVLLVGPDLDLLDAVRWPKPWMRTAAGFLSFIRLPAPALRLTPSPKWYWLYY